MALRKALTHRLFNMRKISSQTPTFPNRAPSTFFGRFLNPLPDSSESGFLRRWLQERGIFNSAVRSEYLSLPIGDRLIERLRGLNNDRIRLDGLSPPPTPAPIPRCEAGISVDDARKLMRVARLEAVKASLRGVAKSCVSYSEFVRIVSRCSGGVDPDEVSGLVRTLDESGVVIVLGNAVFLRPEQVVKAIEGAIPWSLAEQPNDPRRRELEEMQKQKSAIDERAEALVRRELWCGLGFLVVQTVGFMRLTFWELSWDVMEPICFYVTSIYFMAGYAFFLRTNRDPSYEGFFESRFSAKQKRLMKRNKFDLHRFNELRTLFDSSDSSSSSSSPCSRNKRELLGAIRQ